jgi:hypothetical protein
MLLVSRYDAGCNTGAIEIGILEVGWRTFRAVEKYLKDVQASRAAEVERIAVYNQIGLRPSHGKSAEAALPMKPYTSIIRCCYIRTVRRIL